MDIKKILLQAIMSNAWKYAKDSAAKFGGRAAQYFPACLREIWAIFHIKPTNKNKPATSLDLRSVRYDDYAGQDIIGWAVSEKIHGIWAEWNGENFLTRNGTVLAAPESFKKGLPLNEKLHGELYLGIGKFQELCGIVRSKNGDWRGITFNLFKPAKAKLPSHVKVIEQVIIYSMSQVHSKLNEIIAKGGEGLCVTNGEVILKIKPRKSIEAWVKSANSQQSVKCLLNNGVEFNVKVPAAEKLKLIGQKITVEFMNYTAAGKPFHPVFIGARFDL